MKNPLLLACLVVLLHCLLVVFSFFSRKSRSFLLGAWPLSVLGNLLQLGRSPHQTLACMAQQYGPFMYLWLGLMHNIVLSSPAMAKEVLKTHDHVFRYRPSFICSEVMNDNCSIALSSGAN